MSSFQQSLDLNAFSVLARLFLYFRLSLFVTERRRQGNLVLKHSILNLAMLRSEQLNIFSDLLAL